MAVIAVIAISSSGAEGSAAPSAVEVEARATAPEKCPDAKRGVKFYRSRFHEHREKMGADRPDEPAVLTVACPQVRFLARVWKSRAEVAKTVSEWFQLHSIRAERRALYAKWECIHRHEGAWNDPNPPYWGGLQMNWGFMQAYGAEFLRQWGTADKWPPWAQIQAAERAWKTRGWHPWPNTARMCGLL